MLYNLVYILNVINVDLYILPIGIVKIFEVQGFGVFVYFAPPGYHGDHLVVPELWGGGSSVAK